jgi:hypothetical protein
MSTYIVTAFTYICDVTFHLLNRRLNCRSIGVMLKMLENMWLHMSVGTLEEPGTVFFLS